MRGLVWKIIGLVISLSIAAYLLRKLDLASFVSMVRTVPIWSLLAALTCYLLLNVFRLQRFRVLLDRRDIPFQIFYPIVLYHNFLVRTLPFKTGELSYVVLLRQYLERPLREGVSSLISSRLFELFMVVIVGGGALLLASDNTVLLVEIVLVLVGAVVFLTALYFSGPLLRLAARILRSDFMTFGPQKLVALRAQIAKKLDALSGPFDRVQNPAVFRRLLMWSVLTYSMSVSFNLALFYGLGIDTNPGVLIGIISIVSLTDALPLATISGLGMIEGGWTFGLVVFAGFPVDQAALMGFFLHGCQLLAAATTGILGYLWLQRFSLNPSMRRKELG